MARDEERLGVRLTSPVVLRALAHPARLRMLDVLVTRDGATATQCAEVVGLSPSACSWHLRQLAAAGLVRDARQDGDGREKVWKATVPSWQVDLDDIEADPPEAQGLDLAVTQALLQATDTTVEAFTVSAAQGLEPPEWRRASIVSNSNLRITADELRRLTDGILELLQPYKVRERPDPAPGQRIVHVGIRLVPATPTTEAPPPT